LYPVRDPLNIRLRSSAELSEQTPCLAKKTNLKRKTKRLFFGNQHEAA
jgi:hypothetical protein